MNQQAQNQKNEGTQKNSGSKNLIYFLGIFGIIIIALAIWLFISMGDIAELKELKAEKEQQRVELKSELDTLLVQHNKIKEVYGQLSDTLYLRDSIIQEDAKEIKKLLDTKWRYYKIKKKIAKLQLIAQGYVHQMDSLYSENKTLKNENVKITKNYNSEVKKNVELTKIKDALNEKVNTASILKTYNLKAEAIQLRWGGRKTKVVTKAKKVDKIKINFTLSENTIIPAGTKEIFIRIAKPDKLILTPSRRDSYSFMYKGEQLQYSIKKEIDYQNEAQNLQLFWTNKSTEKMIVGTYHVEIFVGNNVIGQTKFTLN